MIGLLQTDIHKKKYRHKFLYKSDQVPSVCNLMKVSEKNINVSKERELFFFSENELLLAVLQY